MHNRKLTDRQRELLTDFKVTDNVARFTRHEQIPDWPVVKKVFIALGAAWKGGKVGGFVFPDDVVAEDVLRVALESGEILDPKLAGFFETPVELARELVAMARVGAKDHALEPSAGRGRIAVALVEAGARVSCVELLDANVRRLQEFGFYTAAGDFLQTTPDPRSQYTAIVMNPPFAKQVDIDHIMHAHKFLAPGGRLVSVASAGVMWREDKKTKTFRVWLSKHMGTMRALPERSFIESGTAVNTCVVCIGC